MTDLKSILEENKQERERLLKLMSGLKEAEFAKRLPNGWTVGVTLAHLAFWDFRQAWLLEKWLREGGKGPVFLLDVDAINAALASLSAAIPRGEVVRLTQEATEKADGLVAGMTQAQVDEFLKVGSERFLRRSLHRKDHLDKLEKALKG